MVDGNYSAVQPLVLARADTVIWLDYSIGTKLGRLLRRTLRRVLTHEVLWGTNTESLRQAFSSRSSIFVWLFKTHWAQRRHYEALLSSPAHAHLTRIRLGEPGAAQRLIMSL